MKTMFNAYDFIRFALVHADKDTIPESAILPCELDECGTDPWRYLAGTSGDIITEVLLDERFKNYYELKGWSEEAFRLATDGFLYSRAVDCCGLLNFYFGSNMSANDCYSEWCDQKYKGPIVDPFVDPYSLDVQNYWRIGEAVFYRNSAGIMTHMGYVCGFDAYGSPLIVEARGIRFGVVVTKLSERPWTHRGLITSRLNYSMNNENDNPDEELISEEDLYALFDSC